MCKGGGRVLSNVELILPWNVVEACYTLERNDSTCFFAANDSEGTTSQISLCKLEDHSVKIQVTVTALESDDDPVSRVEPQPEDDATAEPNQRYTLWGTDGETAGQTAAPQTPVRPQKAAQPDVEAPEEVEAPQRRRGPSLLRPSQSLMNKTLMSMWRRKRRRHRLRMAEAFLSQSSKKSEGKGFDLQRARSILGKSPVVEKARHAVTRARTFSKKRDEPLMPTLQSEQDDEPIDLDLIYKYGPQMREFEEKRRRERANWDRVQQELKQSKDGRSMVIVLKGEGEEGVKEVEEQEEPEKPTPKLHVIEPLPVDPQDAVAEMQQEVANFDESTQVIYIHSGGKNNGKLEEEDIDEGKKFFKRRRDKATRVAKDTGSKNKPLWKQQLKKSLKVEPDRGGLPEAIGCNFCPRTFKELSYLFRHIKGHHMDKEDAADILDELRPKMKVNCPVCNKLISSMANVPNHMKQCHPENETPVKCEMCEKVYKTPASLKQHVRQRHSDTPKRFNCPQCNMVFGEKRGLTDHVNCVHETTQVFTCNKCWKVFLTKSRLRRHMYIHGEHRHICKECGKGFHIKDNMNKHIRIVHEKNNGKMWKCSYCSKEFLVKGNMTQHIRGIHLKQFPFTCSKCQQGFRRMRDMMLHMEKCTDDSSINMEMFRNDIKQEGTPKVRGRPTQKVLEKRQTPRMSSKKVEKRDSEEEEEEGGPQEYVIHDEMVVSGDEEGLEEEEEEELEEEEEEGEEEEEEEGETREVILNSQGPEDSMQLHIEQDGVVIPIEVVIGQGNDGENEGAEVIADGASK